MHFLFHHSVSLYVFSEIPMSSRNIYDIPNESCSNVRKKKLCTTYKRINLHAIHNNFPIVCFPIFYFASLNDSNFERMVF